MKFFFHHIPKCAGRYLITQFRNNEYKERQFSFDSEKVFNYDYAELEHLDDLFIETEDFFPRKYNWWRFMPPFGTDVDINRIRESIKRFRKHGYVPLTFVRDPRDALCSLYFYFWERVHPGWKNNAAKLQRWKNRHTGLLDYPRLNDFLMNVNIRFVPHWWEDYDFVGVVDESGDDFNRFFTKYGLDGVDMEKKVGKSKNRGYHVLCEQGIIKRETQDFLESSEDFKVFQDLLKRYK